MAKEPLLEQINDYWHSRSPSKASLRHASECTIELVVVGPVHIGAPAVAAGTQAEGSALLVVVRSCD